MLRIFALVALLSTNLLAVISSESSRPEPDRVEPNDIQDIISVSLDYINGWYDGDAARMEYALHPELAKRIVRRDTVNETLEHMSALSLVQRTRRGIGKKDRVRRADVQILSLFKCAAAVRIDATEWVDFLHLAKVEGSWKIVNVLWERR